MDRLKELVAQVKLALERARARYAVVDITLGTFARFSRDDGGSYSAALTYYLFFSIFPLLLFSVSVLGYITFNNTHLQHRIFDSGLNTVPLLKDALTPGGLQMIQNHRGSLAVTGLILALYSGSGAVVALGHALNKVLHIGEEGNFIQKRLRSLGWLVVLGAASAVSLGITGVAEFAGPLAAGIGVLGGLAMSFSIFATAFKFLPSKPQGWGDVWPGAVVAAVAFEILKFAGALYLAHGSKARNDTFGALAGAATLLIASYLISQVILLAAEVNAVLGDRRATRPLIEPVEEGR